MHFQRLYGEEEGKLGEISLRTIIVSKFPRPCTALLHECHLVTAAVFIEQNNTVFALCILLVM
jgi:hypothetical protein